MKTVLKTDVPKNVISCINEMVLDFSTFLSVAHPPKKAREEIQEKIDCLNKVLQAQEWKINHFGVLVEHFFESKINNTPQAKKDILAQQILKECELVLSYCEQHFEITYFPNGTFLMSQKIGKVG